MQTIKKGKVTWIDALNPTEEDLKVLKKKFNLHDIIVKELQEPSARARVEQYDDYIYLIFYLPIFDPIEQTSKRSEIDILVSKNMIVTVHYELLPMLETLRGQEFKNTLDATYMILELFLSFQERQLRHIREKVEDIGRSLFKNMEKEILERASRLKRDVSEYRIIVRHQGPLLNSLLDRGIKFWGEESRIYFDDLVGDHFKIVNQLEDYREAIVDFAMTNNQLLGMKTNEVMKTTSVLAFLGFPLVFIAALFTIPAKGIPIIHNEGGFWVIVAMMAVTAALAYYFFKKKKWL